MPSFNDILNQYLLHFKKYFLDLDLSLNHRTSILSSQGTTPNFQEIAKLFSDGEIEKEFESLQNKLNRYPDTSHLELYIKFNDFFKSKTDHSLESERVIGFFKDRNESIAGKKLLEIVFLESISFAASADLQESFNAELKSAINITAEEDNDSFYELIKEQFKEASTYPLSRFNLSYHPKAFEQLDQLGLGDQSNCILELLGHPPQLINIEGISNQVKEIFENAKKSIPTEIESTQQNLIAACYEKYQANVIGLIFNFFIPKEKNQEDLELQLFIYENEFLSSSNFANHGTQFESFCPKILEIIKASNKEHIQESDSQLFFSQQKEKTTFDSSASARYNQ
ncbi:hypothetical protein AVI51_14805 [Piscirickettsia salmonis]|uniref:Uncharacterized protein n=1 Tax=Piscirickettsia salmonis TaxID=1238 RepID=A0A9Q5YJ19_PISSA|nr:hypothetical protein [Piscirickettsia salmonis]ALA24298.1 hypothetical protein KW89_830 [Piscirickettsia salmonis]APS48037.1 hypothetical protein AVI49_10685 [Piscirickettsia salmonis]APS51994.1 hypothetical protein AVI50_14960 [Piscirickettsia salmonis]APS55211.1 hypothetical protein AVI51_14805 [Piscirickettsia salmonis]APS58334.1 hypothetical protein AVI52_14530 [Piscirickettsia salmonis]